MGLLDKIQETRTELTYRSCSRLGMRYVDTFAPQYYFQIVESATDKSGWRYPTFHDYVRVVFRPSNGYKAELSYTADHHSLSNRNWIDIENPSEEDLVVVIEAIKTKFGL